MRFHLVLPLVCGLAASPIVLAADDAIDPVDAVDNPEIGYNDAFEVPWIEIEVNVNKLPEEKNLTELELLYLPPGITMFADLENLDVSETDRVSRLWLVSRSDKGATNAAYYGFRCATYEYKTYAYANPARSKPLRLVRSPRWRELRNNDYRNDFMVDYLCATKRPKTPHEVRNSLPGLPGEYIPAYLK